MRALLRGRALTYLRLSAIPSVAVIGVAATSFLFVLGGAAAGLREEIPSRDIPSRDIRRAHVRAEGWSSEGIVFVRYFYRQKDTDSYQIAVASLDGSRRQVVVFGGEDCFDASVSPSGREITYSGDADYVPEYDQWVCDIFVARADGSEPRNLSNTPESLGRANQEFAPKWSPDGSAIAYERRTYAARIGNWNHDLVVLELSSGSVRIVGRGQGVVWSPDSRRLAFSSGLSQRDSAVFSVGRDGSGRRRLTGRAGWVAASWSPNGHRLLVERHPQSARSSIWTMEADGSNKRRLVRGDYAKWAPNSNWIAFGRPLDSPSDEPVLGREATLLVVRADGTGLRRLTTVSSLSYAWAPDGRRLAIPRKNRCLHSGIHIVDLYGRSRSVTNDCRMRGTNRDDVLVGTEERDLVWGLAGSDRIDTGPGDRQYDYGSDPDIVWAGPGDDFVRTGPGQDVVYGGPGADRIEGDQLRDTLSGGPGDDVLRGGRNQDRLLGGTGHDRLFGGPHADTLFSRDGEGDELACGSGEDRAVADALDRVAADCETIVRS